MKRRSFLKLVLSLPAAALAAGSAKRAEGAVLQESPVAGFQFHRGEAVWPLLRRGASLRMVREPSNPYDPKAVALYFGTDKIGYVPRRENAVVARLLDQGVPLRARITRLRSSPDPWERVRFEVRLG